MHRSRTLILTAIFLLTSGGCSVNILENFANKETNGAYYQNAEAMINSADYNGAITELAKIKGAYASSNPVISLKASAFLGRCSGKPFLTLVTDLGNIGATRLFPWLLSEFIGASSSKIDDCITAQNLILSLGVVGVRSNNDNLILVLIELAKLGKILTYYADLAQTGTRTAAYDSCAVNGSSRPAAAAGSAISDADIGEFGAGIAMIVENLTALSGKVTFGSGTLTNVTGVCTALNGFAPAYNFCAATDPVTYATNTNFRKGVRSLIIEGSALGLQGGACPAVAPNDISIGGCNCP